MAFVKLDCGILNSTLWVEREPRDVFITALLMAVPFEVTVPMPQYRVDSIEKTGFVVPPGWYGFVEAAGPGIVRRAIADPVLGMEALARLGEPDLESRSSDFDGRRLVRVDGGYIILNYMKYRDKDNTAAVRQKRYRDRKREAEQAVGAPTKTESQSRVTSTPSRSNATTNDNALRDFVTNAEEEAEEEKETVVEVGGCGGKDQPPSDEPPVAAGKPAAHAMRPRKTGTRLPDDWALPKPWGEWALAEFPQWTPDKVRLEAAKFADHWHAKTGAEASKLDWLATWRNWCRSDIAHRDDPKPMNGHAPRPGEPSGRLPLYVPPPPLSDAERQAAEAKRVEVMAKFRHRGSA
jgi:hypothetical protein